MAPSVRQAHHAGPDRVADLHRRLDCAPVGRNLASPPVDEPARGRIVGMDQKRAPLAATHQGRNVVQHGVHRARLPTANDHQFGVVVESVAHPGQVGDKRARSEFDAARWCPKDPRKTRLERSQVDAVRMAFEFRERQTAGPGTEVVP